MKSFAQKLYNSWRYYTLSPKEYKECMGQEFASGNLVALWQANIVVVALCACFVVFPIVVEKNILKAVIYLAVSAVALLIAFGARYIRKQGAKISTAMLSCLIVLYYTNVMFFGLYIGVLAPVGPPVALVFMCLLIVSLFLFITSPTFGIWLVAGAVIAFVFCRIATGGSEHFPYEMGAVLLGAALGAIYGWQIVRYRLLAISSNRETRKMVKNFSGVIYRREFREGEWQITFASDGSRELFGYAPEEMISTNFSIERVHPDDLTYVKERVAEFFESDELHPIITITYRMTPTDGETKWVLERAQITERAEDGTALMIEGYCSDVTEYKQMEAAKKVAEDANHQKSRFLATISHEIRTPMNTILGIAEMQLRKQDLPRETEEMFLQIYDSGSLLLNIINDILDMSKIEMGKMEIVPTKYAISSLISDTAQLTFIKCEDKALRFTVQVDENTPLTLFGDEMRIRQVLNNLLSNAFKYTDVGAVDLSIAAETGEGDDVTLVFTVSDTGYGMTKEEIGNLFKEYTRFNVDSKRATTGTGLGLSITKRLLDLMDGEIFVESQPGKGSVFTVRLPQKRIGSEVCGRDLAEKLCDHSFHSASVNEKKNMHREHMPYGSVLIVDDLKSNLRVAKGLLEPYGLRIDTADRGFDAIEKIKRGAEYDVIFMDYKMPGMDGIEVAETLRGLGYERPIVALTANALVGQAEMFLSSGFDAYISKPIDTREMDGILNKFVRDRGK